MKLEDVEWISNNPEFELPRDVTFSDCGGLLAVNGNVGLQLEDVSTAFERGDEIEVQDESGQVLGILCLCKNMEASLNTITEAKYAAYVVEIDKDLYGQPYRFKYDYLVLDVSRYGQYIADFINAAPLWGGFVHKQEGVSVYGNYKTRNRPLRAVSKLHFPTSHHTENCNRSVVQPFAFERFLKLYHLVELLFDFDVVERIRNLGDDLKGIGQILSDYERQDFERLKAVVKTRCSDVDRIATELNRVNASPDYLTLAKRIFFEYGKQSNPYRDKEDKFDEMMGLGGFSEENAKLARLVGGKPDALASQYRELVRGIAVYWIYRIRCSIAHSRIGEYVMTNDDEEFIAEVAEPLLRELLVQALKD